jgi:hypothetical protein
MGFCSVSLLIRLQAGRPRNRGAICGICQTFCSSANLQRLAVQSAHLSLLFPRLKLTSHLHLVPRLMCAATRLYVFMYFVYTLSHSSGTNAFRERSSTCASLLRSVKYSSWVSVIQVASWVVQSRVCLSVCLSVWAPWRFSDVLAIKTTDNRRWFRAEWSETSKWRCVQRWILCCFVSPSCHGNESAEVLSKSMATFVWWPVGS